MPVVPPVSLCVETPCTDSVVITYLGVSGLIIRSADEALMTGPSFTHQNLAFVALPFIPVSPNTELIDWALAREKVDDVAGILIGHSHYDHLLDVPYIATTLATHASIYGGPTMANTLAPVGALSGRLVAIDTSQAGTTTSPGKWFTTPGGRIRFMALRSSHAPNLGNYTYANDVERAPRKSLPRTTHGWHLGEVYAYLIDVLDASGGKPVFRIFYQDAAAEPSYSALPPLPPGDERPVDLAVICAGNFGNASDYPTALLMNMRPGRVLVSHWEDFFRSPFPPFKGITRTNTERLASLLDAQVKERWVAPEPLAHLVFRY